MRNNLSGLSIQLWWIVFENQIIESTVCTILSWFEEVSVDISMRSFPMCIVIHFTLSRDSTDQFVLPSLPSKTRFIFALSSALRCTSFVSGTLSWGIMPFFLSYAFSLPHLHKIPTNRIDGLMFKILLQRRLSGLASSCTVCNDFKKLEDWKTIFLTNGWNTDT